MRMQDLIEKKKKGFSHTREELKMIVDGIVDESIPDYQLSAWLMAICFQGMTDEELSEMIDLMARSGDMTDLGMFGDQTVDKHSTGGVGDKTTLILVPLISSLGAKVAKMSGRGLGFTGGTVDKLESIPGFRTEFTVFEFLNIVQKHGACMAGQSGKLTPADKKLYALRDVTATVDSIPLIASSIMSKKLAAGAKSIVLDVKTGNGAFMQDLTSAELLAEKMVTTGKMRGRNVCAVLTNMNVPLGCAVGNSLEVKEAIEVLQGKGPDDLKELTLVLGTKMLELSLGENETEARSRCERALADGTAFRKFKEMIEAQGGDPSCADHPERLPSANTVYEIRSEKEGYIAEMDCALIGKTATLLGAGREKKGDSIDLSAGIVLAKKTGDFVSCGEPLAYLHTNRDEKLGEAEMMYREAISFSPTAVEKDPLVYKIIG